MNYSVENTSETQKEHQTECGKETARACARATNEKQKNCKRQNYIISRQQSLWWNFVSWVQAACVVLCLVDSIIMTIVQGTLHICLNTTITCCATWHCCRCSNTWQKWFLLLETFLIKTCSGRAARPESTAQMTQKHIQVSNTLLNSCRILVVWKTDINSICVSLRGEYPGSITWGHVLRSSESEELPFHWSTHRWSL